MNLIEQFEYPLPILKINIEKLVIDITVLGYKGSILLENEGGSVLTGNITSKNPFIKFSKEEFEGNKLEIPFEIKLEFYHNDDIIHSSILISSNGGEKIIPVIIKVIPHAMTVKDAIKITTVKDFLFYAKKYPLEAKQLFVSYEFLMWLINSNFEFIDIYEKLIRDPNKERAIENFFILAKVKNKVYLKQESSVKKYNVVENSLEVIQDGLLLKKSGWGFVEEEVCVKYNVPWLSIKKDRVTHVDFGGNEEFVLPYEIISHKLYKKKSLEKIFIGENEFTIKLNKIPLYNIKLKQEYLNFKDTGFLIVSNEGLEDVVLQILSKDSFIRFEGDKYRVGNYAEIPFILKFSPLLNAQMALKKQPTIESQFIVRILKRDIKVYEKTLKLIIGNYGD